MNAQQEMDLFNEFCDTIDTVMAETGIRSRMDAADEVRRRYPHLRNAKYPGKPGMTMTTSAGASQSASTAISGGNAETELNARAKRIAAERHCTYAQAYVEALNSDTRLYLRYLKEQQARIEAARRG
jgi:hypothetical protein